MIKVITLLKRKPGLSLEEFYRYWRENHAPLALQDNPQMTGYVQNHGLILPEGEQAYDGVAETYWPDMDAFQAAVEVLQSEAGKAHLEDLEKFTDLSQMVSIITEEKVIK